MRIQADDFDAGTLQDALLGDDCATGAVATFTGYARNTNAGREVASLVLEHYPGMTESSIESILREAAQRWPLLRASVVHRVGELGPGDRIVWVGVAAMHREPAFSACEFIMDYLKTRAPLWKKEGGPEGARWVEARQADGDRARRWRDAE